MQNLDHLVIQGLDMLSEARRETIPIPDNLSRQWEDEPTVTVEHMEADQRIRINIVIPKRPSALPYLRGLLENPNSSFTKEDIRFNLDQIGIAITTKIRRLLKIELARELSGLVETEECQTILGEIVMPLNELMHDIIIYSDDEQVVLVADNNGWQIAIETDSYVNSYAKIKNALTSVLNDTAKDEHNKIRALFGRGYLMALNGAKQSIFEPGRLTLIFRNDLRQSRDGQSGDLITFETDADGQSFWKGSNHFVESEVPSELAEQLV